MLRVLSNNSMTPPTNLPFEPEPTDAELEAIADAPVTPPPVRRLEPEITTPPAMLSTKPLSEPEDMFGETAPMRPVQRTPVMPTMAPVVTSTGPSMVKVGLLVLLVVVLLGGAGYGVYSLMKPSDDVMAPVLSTTTTKSVNNQNVTTPVTPEPLPSEEVTESTTTVALPPPITIPPSGVTIPLPSTTSTPVVQPAPSVSSPIDTDSDGLKDEQELELGLDPKNADSDMDGLTDGDENKLYGTNPLIKDTDGDSYLDGAEVKNGYNPRGTGKCQTATCEAPSLTP